MLWIPLNNREGVGRKKAIYPICTEVFHPDFQEVLVDANGGLLGYKTFALFSTSAKAAAWG